MSSGPWGNRPTGGGGQNGGPSPWQKPSGGKPGGSGGGGRPPSQDDIERRLREWEDRLKRMFGGGGRGLKPQGLAALGAVALLIWVFTGFYFVEADEKAVVTRFGKFHHISDPGLRYALPTPIDKIQKVRVTTSNRADIGFVGNARSGNKREIPEESLMLTGDENIVDIEFSVFWRVSDAAKFVFNIERPDLAVKAMAESAMREVVGKSGLQSIITTGRSEIQGKAQELMQQALDDYNSGVLITQVQIQRADPPADVIDAFREVVNAAQDAESKVNEALAYRNRVVPEARGDAAKILQDAEAYKERITREAQGEAERFNQLYAEYRLAPAVTRERLYLETMERVLAKAEKVVLDAKAGQAPVILPIDRRPVTPPTLKEGR